MVWSGGRKPKHGVRIINPPTFGALMRRSVSNFDHWSMAIGHGTRDTRGSGWHLNAVDAS